MRELLPAWESFFFIPRPLGGGFSYVSAFFTCLPERSPMILAENTWQDAPPGESSIVLVELPDTEEEGNTAWERLVAWVELEFGAYRPSVRNETEEKEKEKGEKM